LSPKLSTVWLKTSVAQSTKLSRIRCSASAGAPACASGSAAGGAP
jgi:hypothetical protein